MTDQALSLLDIGPATEAVPIGAGRTLTVAGISAKDIFGMFQRFPSMRSMMSGQAVDPAQALSVMPDAMAAVITIGAGFSEAQGKSADDIAHAEQNASRLPIEIQLDLIERIFALTFKAGFGPFADRVTFLANLAASFGRGTATNSPQGSTASSDTDTSSTTSGE